MNKKDITKELTEEREMLAAIMKDAERRLSKAPEGLGRMQKHGQGYQFYQRQDSADKSGKYLPVSQRKKGIALVQKGYDQKVLAAARKQLQTIDRFLQKYDPEVFKSIYSGLSEGRKLYVSPVEISDQEFVRRWEAFEFSHKEFVEGTAEHYTSKGERVRSKSEVMIADALKQAVIPYKYECPLKLGSITVHPDFTILRTGDREEIYWEHLGMMDDMDYCNKAIQKLRQYEINGIYPGINLLMTMETTSQPINLAVINRVIDTYCV